MSLQPIDLQTLFVRLSQIGKEQAALKEGAVLQQEARGAELAKQARLNDETVLHTNELQQESGRIKDHQEGSFEQGEQKREAKEEQAGSGREKGKKKNFFEDPDLGKNIDISG
jgi:hypothetical protein